MVGHIEGVPACNEDEIGTYNISSRSITSRKKIMICTFLGPDPLWNEKDTSRNRLKKNKEKENKYIRIRFLFSNFYVYYYYFVCMCNLSLCKCSRINLSIIYDLFHASINYVLLNSIRKSVLFSSYFSLCILTLIKSFHLSWIRMGEKSCLNAKLNLQNRLHFCLDRNTSLA